MPRSPDLVDFHADKFNRQTDKQTELIALPLLHVCRVMTHTQNAPPYCKSLCTAQCVAGMMICTYFIGMMICIVFCVSLFAG